MRQVNYPCLRLTTGGVFHACFCAYRVTGPILEVERILSGSLIEQTRIGTKRTASASLQPAERSILERRRKAYTHRYVPQHVRTSLDTK